MNTIKLAETTDDTGQETGMPKLKLSSALKQVILKKMTSSQEFNKWNLDALIEYILNNHHRYAKENTIIIYNLAQKVAYRHGENQPELIKLTTTMFLFFHDLLHCMRKEEELLFPGIKQLGKDKSNTEEFRYTNIGLIRDWVSLIHKEHQSSIKYLKLFREHTNDYMLPQTACNSYKYLFERMKQFEDDLLMHLHLENDILFPKAVDENKELD